MRNLFRLLVIIAALPGGAWLHGAERMLPAPARHFNDYTATVAPATARTLDQRLEQYERESSNQLLVAVYPRMESDSSVEDYTVRVAQAWRAGQPGKNNGAVLFVFKADRQLYIQTGYGLEATLTDATCHDIVENILKPRFRAGDFDGGLSGAVEAMIAATKGEYRGTGRTQADAAQRHDRRNSPLRVIFIVLVVLFLLANGVRRSRHPSVFMNPRRRSSTWWDIGGGSSGGGWGSGGGGFSGGGGSFGGGGAGGKW